MSRLKDKLLEVELFVAEKLQDLTNEQVIKEVRKHFGSQMFVDHAKDVLYEFQQDVNFQRLQERTQSW
jgi:hypothetical protein